MIDEAKDIRPGETLDEAQLHQYLISHLKGYTHLTGIRQFPGGYSNLTYLVQTNAGDFVLRRPPFGANIKSAHDMGREFRVLSLLQPHYARIPQPVLFCEDPEVLGAPFYLMERVKGVILRNRLPKDIELTPDLMRQISTAAVDNLVSMHQLDIYSTNLVQLGKPEGYVERQVEGWIQRYYKSETDEIGSMNELAQWMPLNKPADGAPGLIHNDYKYDNLVLNPNDLGDILAVLDWEMCTVGDPLMDLGTSLAYWVEPQEANLLLSGIANLTWLPGNLSRAEIVARYAEKSGRDVSNILFYFVFGAFKIGVIVQQIYYRYKQGHTQDPRFAALIDVVRIFGGLGRRALEKGRISPI